MKLKRKGESRAVARARSAAPEIPVELPELPESGIEKNEYYLHVSGTYKLLRLVTAGVLFLFVILMLILRPNDITVSNILYLFRDINVSADGGEAFSGVSYSAEPIQRFSVFRGELLYVTGREVKLFSSTGGLGLSAGISYEDPAVDVSEKYALVYDIGGRTFTLYNSFSELYRETLDYGIVSADMCPTGDFVIVTTGREHRSEVYLYGDDFVRRALYKKADYVSCAALSDDGSRLLLTSFGTENGEYYTDASFYDVGADEVGSSVRIAGEYPLAARATDGGFAVITDACVYMYGTDGALRGSYVHGGGLGTVSVGGGYVLLTCPKNALGSENSVIILDSEAKVCYNAVVGEKIADTALSAHKEAFLLTPGHAVMIDIASGEEMTASVGAGARRIIPVGEGTALICMASSAATASFPHGESTGAP